MRLSRPLALIYVAGAAANVWINHAGKGAWDLYPAAELLWVLVSLRLPRRLATAVLVLLFVDSFVDACAMGQAWFAGPPVLVEWHWRGLDRRLLYAYWAVKWGLQVPARCAALAAGTRRPLLVWLGLNLIWLTAPQDVLFYFVWRGLYDWSFPYFHYLPPAGLWNLWNMLLLRVPIGVTAGALLARKGLNSA